MSCISTETGPEIDINVARTWHDPFQRYLETLLDQVLFGADDGNRTRVFSLGS